VGYGSLLSHERCVIRATELARDGSVGGIYAYCGKWELHMILHNTVCVQGGAEVNCDIRNKIKGKVHPRTGH